VLTSPRLADHLRHALAVALAVVAWLLVGIGTMYGALGLGLVWLGRQVSRHGLAVGALIGAIVVLTGWATVVFGAAFLAGGLALLRLELHPASPTPLAA
jgi:hypothetical protein